MSWTYVDDSNQPFVLVGFDPDRLDLPQALRIIEESGRYDAPLVIWRPGTMPIDEAQVLTEEQRRLNQLPFLLSAGRRLRTKTTFLFGIDPGELWDMDPGGTPKDDSLPILFPMVYDQLHDVPGKKLILVLAENKLDQFTRDFLGGRLPGKVRFIESTEITLPPDLAEFERVVKQVPPAAGKWDFADNDNWMKFIEEELSQDAIQELVKRGLHLPSVNRLRQALAEVQARFERRDHALEMIVACALARVNLVLLGPPGTAKSLMVRSFSEALGVRSETRSIREEDAAARQARQHKLATASKRRMFEYLLTRYTTPEEIFGGADIDLLLSAGVHGRRTEGMLPQAETAFLDEIFKANSAILNTLLSLTNERIFYNMGQAFRVNLAFVVGASNETPAEEELGALYDRFPIRVPCRSVDTDKDQLFKVIQHAHRFACGRELDRQQDRITRRACLNDLRLLSKVLLGGVYGGVQEFESNSSFPDQFMNVLCTIRRDFGVSDRTMSQVLHLCRALGLLEAEAPAPKLEPRHLRAWAYVAPKLANAADLQHIVKSKIAGFGETHGDLFDAI